MSPTVKTIIAGLLGAAMQGAVDAISSQSLTLDYRAMGRTAGVGALIAIVAYLKQSPVLVIPKEQVSDVSTVKTVEKTVETSSLKEPVVIETAKDKE